MNVSNNPLKKFRVTVKASWDVIIEASDFADAHEQARDLGINGLQEQSIDGTELWVDNSKQVD